MREERFPAIVVIASAAALLSALFLPWYGTVAHTPAGTILAGADAWHASAKIAAMLTGIAAITLALGWSGVGSPRMMSMSSGHLKLLGTAALGLIVFRLVSGPYDVGVVSGSQGPIGHAGAFVALAAAMGLLAGARLARPRPLVATAT